MAVQSASKVADYLGSLSSAQRSEIEPVLAAVRQTLPPGYEERLLQSNMIGWVVPHELFPAGYHCNPKQPLMLGALAVNKTAYSLHLISVYGNEALRQQLVDAFKASGKKLDMGKACIRFRKAQTLDLEAISSIIAAVPPNLFIERYLAAIGDHA